MSCLTSCACISQTSEREKLVPQVPLNPFAREARRRCKSPMAVSSLSRTAVIRSPKFSVTHECQQCESCDAAFNKATEVRNGPNCPSPLNFDSYRWARRSSPRSVSASASTRVISPSNSRIAVRSCIKSHRFPQSPIVIEPSSRAFDQIGPPIFTVFRQSVAATESIRWRDGPYPGKFPSI